MDGIPVLKIVGLVLLLAMSAFFSSAETALSTSSRIRLQTEAAAGSKAAALSVKLLDKYSRVIGSILIGNNIANIAASSIMTLLAVQVGFSVSAATGILTVIILLFSEILPKNLSRLSSDKLIKLYAPFLNFLIIIMYPVVWVLTLIEKGVLKLMRVDPNFKPPMTEAELRAYIELGHEDDVIEDDERAIIENVIDFGDKTVEEVMTPRSEIVAVSTDDSYDSMRDTYRGSMYTRMPVYDGDLDHIVGTLNIKDFAFSSPESFNIRDNLQPAMFTHENRLLKNTLEDMRRENMPVAYVIDEYGSLAGMVTIEDILSEIVGGIGDEYNGEDAVTKVSDGVYKADGSASIADVNHILGTSLDAGDYNTVGGFIISAGDKLPSEGDVIVKDGIRCTVNKVEGNKIIEVTIEVLPK